MAADEDIPGETTAEEPSTAEGGARRAVKQVRGRVASLVEGPLELVKAVVLGVKDTAKDVADGARAEAAAAYEERWTRFEDLTKHRRKRREGRAKD